MGGGGFPREADGSLELAEDVRLNEVWFGLWKACISSWRVLAARGVQKCFGLMWCCFVREGDPLSPLSGLWSLLGRTGLLVPKQTLPILLTHPTQRDLVDRSSRVRVKPFTVSRFSAESAASEAGRLGDPLGDQSLSPGASH